MCGIVGYVGGRDAVPVILDGLRRLEYRGYDSAGIAVVSGGELLRRRAAGKLGNLAESLAREPLAGEWGLGHTRWATHGRPTEENAHPHQDGGGRIVVVHNGIIENHLELKARLAAAGHRFVSQTDTEVVAHLVASHYQGSLEQATRRALAEIRGVYALVLMHRDEPRLLVAARLGPPLVIGLAQHEHYVASDIPALLPHTRDFVFLEDGDVATLTPDAVRITTLAGAPVARPTQRIAWDPVQAEKGGFRHFMLKEIHEQPRAMRDTLLGRISLEEGEVHLEELGPAAERLRGAERAVLVACGTSWHAALVGKFLIEHLAQIPVEVDYGSEFRYRKPLVGPSTLAVAISQSGETADTLGAFREAKARGALPIAICNVQGSMLVREAAGSLLTHAGPEIGVASTKAFTAQLVALSLLALHLGRLRGSLSAEACRDQLAHLTRIPLQMERVLDQEPRIEELSRSLKDARDFLYLGRGVNYPIALEGALKLKEISYLHAEGYPAGEMKHGPIALVDESLPVVALCPGGSVHEKMLSNLQEAKARGGRVIAVGQAGDRALAELVDASRDVLLEIPAAPELWSPFLTVIPLQLIAYHVALRAGRDVDQPRNLAKSVTVE
jgi:glucosamine--fructose-6-phosphate aminotransferase (isomerizing)